MQPCTFTYMHSGRPVEHTVEVSPITVAIRPTSVFQFIEQDDRVSRKVRRNYEVLGELDREHEALALMYANITLFALMREHVMPPLGLTSVKPMRHALSNAGAPVDYTIVLDAQLYSQRHDERYRNDLNKFLWSEEQVRWSETRSLDGGAPVVVHSLLFPMHWFDEDITLPTPVYGVFTSSSHQAKDACEGALALAHFKDALRC